MQRHWADARCFLDLYDRWERDRWVPGDRDPRADRSDWEALRPFSARGLTDAIREFFLGESAVTETLAPLVQRAPTHEARIFLCTQLADEAIHTVFFQRYMNAVVGAPVPPHVLPAEWADVSGGFRSLLDDELRAVTEAVASSTERPAAWYEAVTVYHLVSEGVVAVTGMRAMKDALGVHGAFPTLSSALRDVARDESRHIEFGVTALARGVREGYGEMICARLLRCLPHATHWLVSPVRRYPGALAGRASATLAEKMDRRWTLALGALCRRLDRIGLSAIVPEVEATWQRTIDAALQEYNQRYAIAHPAQALRREATR